MWNVRMDEAQARIKISGRNINNLRYVDNTTLMAESKEELNSLLIWPPDTKSCLTGKDPAAGKDRRQEEKEDEMVGMHHWLNGHESEQAPGDGKGQGGPACCSPWGRKESDTTEWLNNKNNSQKSSLKWGWEEMLDRV